MKLVLNCVKWCLPTYVHIIYVKVVEMCKISMTVTFIIVTSPAYNILPINLSKAGSSSTQLICLSLLGEIDTRSACTFIMERKSLCLNKIQALDARRSMLRQRSLLVSLKSHHIAWYLLCLVSFTLFAWLPHLHNVCGIGLCSEPPPASTMQSSWYFSFFCN